MIRFLHAADFHLDSAYGALTPQQAQRRRQESRELVEKLADYVNEHEISLVLLAGDLFDSDKGFSQTGTQLSQTLSTMNAKVFVASGNHDWCSEQSPYNKVKWPENVHIFKKNNMETVELPQWNMTVSGAGFVAPEQMDGLLTGFSMAQDGRVHMGVLHGEVQPPQPHYNPISKEEIAQSGLTYLALGHTHKRCLPERSGNTMWAWSGCLEGRGFDELGEKGFYTGVVSDAGEVSVEFVPFAYRRHEILTVDVTGKRPMTAIEEALPDECTPHLYRIILTGETGEDGVDLSMLTQMLEERFFSLELRDKTCMAQDVWQRAGEDSLRGLFLRKLQVQLKQAPDEQTHLNITMAARFGLAALDHKDMT